jgi:hypothetical protein
LCQPRFGFAPLIPVVKTANLGYGSDGSGFRRVRGPRFRRVLGQPEVRPGFVLVGHEQFHVPVPIRLIEDHHVFQALAANGADHAFHMLRGDAWNAHC